MAGPKIKDPKLKEMLQSDTIGKQLQMKEELSAIAREKRAVKGKKYWEKVDEYANQLLSKGNESYQDWVSGMCSIAGSSMALAKAWDAEPVGDSDYAAIGAVKLAVEFAGEVVSGVGTVIGDTASTVGTLLEPVYDKVKKVPIIGTLVAAPVEAGKWLGEKAEPVVTQGKALGQYLKTQAKLGLAPRTPKVEFSIDVDNEGHLVSSATKNGVAFNETEQSHFDAGIVAWAKTKGYELELDSKDKDKRILKHKTEGVLTHDKLKTLSMDKDNGLKPFIEGRFGLSMDYESPRPK